MLPSWFGHLPLPARARQELGTGPARAAAQEPKREESSGDEKSTHIVPHAVTWACPAHSSPAVLHVESRGHSQGCPSLAQHLSQAPLWWQEEPGPSRAVTDPSMASAFSAQSRHCSDGCSQPQGCALQPPPAPRPFHTVWNSLPHPSQKGKCVLPT